jgi:D-ribose pyranase
MLITGILNPQIAALLCRFRHTNTLVIADRGFPYWPQVETVDISLTDDLPRVADVLKAITLACTIGRAWMAQEFRAHNSPEIVSARIDALAPISLAFEPHDDFKKRVPTAIGLIRTGDTTQYSNIILQSS